GLSNLGIVAAYDTRPVFVGPVEQITENSWSPALHDFHAQKSAGKLWEISTLPCEGRTTLESPFEHCQLGIAIGQGTMECTMGEEQQVRFLIEFPQKLHS